jgi:hypothetical protein
MKLALWISGVKHFIPGELEQRLLALPLEHIRALLNGIGVDSFEIEG